MRKYVCNDCGWEGHAIDILSAPSPFDINDILLGCPRCKEVNTMALACDEPNCWEKVTCGLPTPEKYRQVCGKHYDVISRAATAALSASHTNGDGT